MKTCGEGFISCWDVYRAVYVVVWALLFPMGY
jgi:hypothetical protein